MKAIRFFCVTLAIIALCIVADRALERGLRVNVVLMIAEPKNTP